MRPECIGSVARCDGGARDDPIRAEAFRKLTEIRTHADGIAAVVFKATDVSCALEVVERIRLARGRRVPVVVEAHGDPVLREFDEVFLVALDCVKLRLHVYSMCRRPVMRKAFRARSRR